MNDTDIASLMFILALIYIPLMIFFVIGYVIQAIATFNMAKKLNLKNPEFAYIPFARFYLLGKIAEENSQYKNLGMILLIIKASTIILTTIFSLIPVLGMIVSIILSMLMYTATVVVDYYIFKMFDNNNTVLYTILVSLFPGFAPIFLYVVSKNTPIKHENEVNGNNSMPPFPIDPEEFIKTNRDNVIHKDIENKN